MKLKKVFLFILLFCVCVINPTITYAQATNFSGKWKLVDHKNLTGTDYANALPDKVSIIQSKDSMMFERTTMGMDGQNVLASETVSFDSKPSLGVTPSKNRKSSILKWSENREECTMISSIYAPGNGDDKISRKITYVFNLISAGAIFTIVKTDENFLNGEVWSVKGIYHRE